MAEWFLRIDDNFGDPIYPCCPIGSGAKHAKNAAMAGQVTV
jgi:hypothetical protein